MDETRTNRGAWRRSPLLPRSMAAPRAPTMSAGPAWAEDRPEERRVPEQMAASGGSDYAPGFDLSPGDDVVEVAGAKVRMGGCLCGAVRYEVHGEPMMVGLCHCEDCRKATGGNALYYADWPVSAVRMEGALATYSGRSFCPDCGSRVAHFSAHHTEVMLGTLDDPPTDLVPRREIWTVRREPWALPIPGAEQFDRDPV